MARKPVLRRAWFPYPVTPMVMPPRKIYHVLPHPAGWAVKIGKAKRASVVAPTKAAAVKAASDLAKSAPKSQVVIRKSTGRFKGDRTYEVSAYRKKRKVRATVSKIRKTKTRAQRRQQRLRVQRRKAALLGVARTKRAGQRRSAAAKKAARTRSKG